MRRLLVRYTAAVNRRLDASVSSSGWRRWRWGSLLRSVMPVFHSIFRLLTLLGIESSGGQKSGTELKSSSARVCVVPRRGEGSGVELGARACLASPTGVVAAVIAMTGPGPARMGRGLGAVGFAIAGLLTLGALTGFVRWASLRIGCTFIAGKIVGNLNCLFLAWAFRSANKRARSLWSHDRGFS